MCSCRGGQHNCQASCIVKAITACRQCINALHLLYDILLRAFHTSCHSSTACCVILQAWSGAAGLKKHAWKAGLHLGCSYDMAAPEWLAIDSDAFIDACAQDVWSIGCLIYRMLTGCMAWEAEGSSYQFVMGILQAHRQWVSAACTSCYHLSLHLWPVNLNFHSMAKAALRDCNLLQAQQTPRMSLHLAKLILFICCCQCLVRKS